MSEVQQHWPETLTMRDGIFRAVLYGLLLWAMIFTGIVFIVAKPAEHVEIETCRDERGHRVECVTTEGRSNHDH